MERPTSIVCEDCGAEVPVGPKGRLPKRCPDCRNPKATSDSPAAATSETSEWPKQVGPCLWEQEDGSVVHGWAWPDASA